MLGLRPAGPVGLAATRRVLAATASLLGPAAAVGQARERLARLAGTQQAVGERTE
jgi:hypothetical protein